MFLHALRIIFILLEVIVLFNLLIVVHELGHFLAARWRGLVIEKFGVWFGKPLWKKTFNGVEYSLGSIPLGGFVALPQLAPMDIIEGETDADRAKLPPISVPDKIIVAVAGPLFSMLLAVVFATLVWAVGHPVGEADMTTVIGYVEPGSPGEKAGLKAGDKILEVDGKRVTRFSGMNDSVTWNVIRSEGETIPFVVERNGQRLPVTVVPYIAPTSGWRRKSVRQVLIYPASKPIIAEVDAATPAAKAGLQPGDIIQAFNGQPIYNAIALADFIRQHPKSELKLDVLRGDSRFQTSLTPVPIMTKGKMMPRIGIAWDTTGQLTIAHPNPVEQVYDSVTSTLNTIEAVISPKSDVKLQHLSGPVGIVRIYYLLFESDRGWQLALWFSVILNVNLAILNMLPIPVLDGGHIVLALVEAVRRKPVNIRVLEIVQTGCAVLIIGYIAYVSFFDVGDWLGDKRGAAPDAEVQASPTP
ncbi:MAG: RIP metalloprotease RseP [Verrucomicrobiota bacterium]|nr:RIP metalloprotease RseP [Chthoniobacterales bacterium]MDQ3414346.1 RIP metalloprotease RseP [Verrucomicrobiota bacterium]